MLQNIWQCIHQHPQNEFSSSKCQQLRLRNPGGATCSIPQFFHSVVRMHNRVTFWNLKHFVQMHTTCEYVDLRNAFSPLWHAACQCLRNWVGGMDKDINAHKPLMFPHFSSAHALFKNFFLGLPWWLSGKESACQCRRHGFDPWSGKIPQAMEQRSPCTTTLEPVL